MTDDFNKDKREVKPMKYLIVTGMSGAGKTNASNILEDMGFYCIDNMPVALISRFAEIYSETKSARDVAFIIDVRGESDFVPLENEVKELKQNGYDCKVLVIDCANDVLINRYKETRRIHPLSAFKNIQISEALELERQMLTNVFEMADYKIDTTYLSPGQARDQIQNVLTNHSQRPVMTVNVISFGFKNGQVIGADLVFDVRCFPNPFYVPELREHTGLEESVRTYVMSFPQTMAFLEKLYNMIDFLIPYYILERKRHLTIAIGCTGGKHRSVAIAEALATHLKENGENTVVIHRDINNSKI